MTRGNNLKMSPSETIVPFPPKATARSLTSVWEKDSLALRLNIRLVGVWGRQCYSTLTGMELAVDLGTGPGQSLTVGGSKGGIRGVPDLARALPTP